ncbi:unnamed protein product [Somion occarium]|uniref:Uncharacterized protein n=1 Tax=Somion occarium TaxID=3059160 RepID=A0ABP1CTW8_9APHY
MLAITFGSYSAVALLSLGIDRVSQNWGPTLDATTPVAGAETVDSALALRHQIWKRSGLGCVFETMNSVSLPFDTYRVPQLIIWTQSQSFGQILIARSGRDVMSNQHAD